MWAHGKEIASIDHSAARRFENLNSNSVASCGAQSFSGNTMTGHRELILKPESEFAIGDSLDPEFYRHYYPDCSGGITDKVLFDHWLSIGKKEGRFPNDDTAVQHFIVNNDLPADFDVEEYLFLNADIRAKCEWNYQAVMHYCKYGKAEKRVFKISGKKTQERKFDWQFYKILNDDLCDLSQKELIEHWLKYGTDEGRHCDLNGYVEDVCGDNILTLDFNVPTYINLNKDLIDQYSDYRYYLKHFIDYGFSEKRKHSPSNIDLDFINSFYECEIENKNSSLILDIIRRKRNYDNYEPVFLNESELCNYYGFRDEELLKVFDHDAYVHLNGVSTASLDGCYRSECLNHFLTIGFKESCDISYSHVFHPSFYMFEYKDLFFKNVGRTVVSNENPSVEQIQSLYEHWLKIGLEKKLHPNYLCLAKSIVGKELPKEIEFEIEGFCKLRNEDRSSEKPSESLSQYIKNGWEKFPRVSSIPKSSAGFLCGVAEKLRREGWRDKAVKLYQMILQGTEGYPEALHNLGDEYLDSGFYHSAIESYLSLINADAAVEWGFINCAECYEKIGDLRSAYKILKMGKKKYPVDRLINEKEKECRVSQFANSYENANRLARVGDLIGARELLKSSLELFDDIGETRKVVRNSKKIAIVANLDLDQCRLYRVEQKVELLNSQGYTVTVYGHNHELSGLYADIEILEAIIFYRVPAFPSIIDAINATNLEGIPSIYDVDDLIFDENEFPLSFASYANQITEDQYNSLAIDTCLVNDAMRRCSHGIASTDYLADYMREYVKSGQVLTLRNGLSSTHIAVMEKHVPNKTQEPVTIFYGSGTKAHKEEFQEIIEPVFLKLSAKHKNRIKFVLVGSFERTESLIKLGDSVTIVEKIDNVSQYWKLLSSCADINISVLQRNPVTNSKSEIKWLEAAMFNIPSVVSKTNAYEESTIHGENILLCETSEEFYSNIDLLVNDSSMRSKIGKNARETVESNYAFDKQSTALTDIISEVKKNCGLDQSTDVRIKVAIVNVFYPPESIGGATRVVHDNVTAISSVPANKFEVEVFCTQTGVHPYELKKYLENGVKVNAVTSPEMSDHTLGDSRMQQRFDEFLDRFKPNVVHFHCIQRLTESIVKATRLRNIPYFITTHDGWWVSDKQFLVGRDDRIKTYNYNNSVLEAIARGSSRQLTLQPEIENAAAVLAVSRSFAHIYENTGLENVVCVENGVSSLARKARTLSDNGKVRLAHIGGMERHKGIHLIKNVLFSSINLNNLELLVVDHAAVSGSYREEKWGNALVKIVAKTPQSQVAGLYSNIDVLIAPSVWPESFGLVTREALACGCWVVASDRGAVGSDVIEGKNGHVVDVSSSQGLSEVLTYIDNNADSYRRSPDFKTILRSSDDQAEDLIRLYELYASSKEVSNSPEQG